MQVIPGGVAGVGSDAIHNAADHNTGGDSDLTAIFPKTANANTWAAKQTFSTEIEIDGNLNHDGSNIGFYGNAPQPRPTVSGSRAGNAALADLLAELANLGLITDTTTSI